MDLLVVTPEEKEKIRESYNKTEQEVKEDVEIIKIWKTKQPHLPQVTALKIVDDFIERLLVRNKFRIERTKEKLDNYFTLRGHNRDLISDFEKILPLKHFITCLATPKLGPNFERILVMKLLNSDPEAYNTSDLMKLNLAMTELCLRYDDSVGVRYILNFEGMSLRHMMKWNPFVMARHANLLEKACSWRIMGIELINAPEFVSKIFDIFKIALPPKIYNRLRVHKDFESLHEIIPKECLPREYGGDFSTIPDLLEKWDKAFKNHRDFFLDNYNKICDESLRPLNAGLDEAFGPDGTFKKLSID